jgi:hypothetical protein
LIITSRFLKKNLITFLKGNNLILTFNKKDYQCKIERGKEDFVKKLISENYFDNGLAFNKEPVTLQELKNLEAIDFEQQTDLKNQIDNLVYELYFSVELDEKMRLCKKQNNL